MLAEEPDVRKALVRFREGLGGNLREAPSLLDLRLTSRQLAAASTKSPRFPIRHLGWLFGCRNRNCARRSKLRQTKAVASYRTPKAGARTVTVNEQVDLFPASSVAVTSMVVVPIGKTVPVAFE